MLKLKDKNKKLIAGLINYKDLCIESVLATGDKTLSFSLHKKDKFYNFIEEECYIETKEAEFVIKARDVGIDYTRFYCVLNLEELEANIFDRFESVEQTITASLNLAIVGTGWTVKDNTLKKKRTVRCTNKNALEIVQEIKKTYRVDIVFNTLKKQIEVYEHLGEDKGTYFIDSLNLIALQVQSDSYKFATRIIAEGKDGLSFSDINNGKNYVENYQYSRKVKTIYWKDERYTIKENLLEDARAKLEELSKPFRSYSASILNLAELNPRYSSILDFKLGDAINLISKKNKIKDKQRIVKTIEWPQDHTKDSVELANATLKFEDIQQENQETTDTVSNITVDNGTVDGSTIDSITTKQIEDFEANVIKVAKLKAILAEIENLHVNKADIQNLNAVIARIGTLEATKASITELNAIHAIIQQIKAGKADITDLNAAVAKVGILENKTAVLENALAGNLTAENFKANAITAGSAVIAEGAIGSSQISSLSVNKLEAGDITTSKHRIVSADGTIEIVGNQILINRNNVNRVILGEYRRADGTTEYGLLVRAKDGQTVMLDGNGVHNAGITDGAIDNNKVADNANISGNKLDINSVIREVNTHGTETIAGTRIQVGDRTLDVELATQKNTITGHSKELSSQKATIQALASAIKLKVDSQTFTQSTTTINNNINKAKQDAINTASTDATNKANNALNSAKAYTNTEITTVNTHLNKNTSEINILKDKIESKVSQSDIDKTIENVKFGDRNLFPEIYLGSHGCIMRKIENFYMNIPTYNIVVNRPNQGNNFGFNIRKPIKINGGKGVTFTFLFNYIINKYINSNSSNMHGYTRVYYKDGSKQDFDFNSKIVNCNDKSNWGKWISLKFTFTTDINKEIDNIGLFYFYTDGASEGTDFNFTIPKLVIGNKIGDWTPAPEDTDQLITDNIKIVTDKISTVESKLTQENNSIKASVRDLNSTTQSITTNVSNINRDLTSKINSNLDAAKNFATDIATNKANTAKQEAISSANSHADSIAASKANEALNNSKAYTNAQINTVNTKVHNVESNLSILSDRINTKVSQSDIDKTVTTIRTERIIYARGTGNDYPANSIVKVNGKTITDGQGRGLRINALNKATLERFFLQDYDTFGSEDAKVSFVNKINELNNGDFIIIITSQDASYPLHQPIKEALEKIGATLFDNKQGTYREAYALIGKSKLGRGNGVEMFIPRTANDKRFAEVSVKVGEDGTFIGVNPNNMGLEATLIKSNISDVSSSVTQLRDSVTTQINSINSKTHSIESTLGGKANKQEIIEVNNRVSTIKASLDGITQRVSATESKTHTLETNLNGKASKQEVNNVSSKVVSLEANLNGITNRVSSTESRINTLNGQVANATTKQEFTEFKQSTNKFIMDIQQSGNENLCTNGGFESNDTNIVKSKSAQCGNAMVSGKVNEIIPQDGGNFFFIDTNGGDAYALTTLSFMFEEGQTYTISVDCRYASLGGKITGSSFVEYWGNYSRIWESQDFGYNWHRVSSTWTAPAGHGAGRAFIRFGIRCDKYAWGAFDNVKVEKGTMATGYTSPGNSICGNTITADKDKLRCQYEDGAYTQMGRNGFEWWKNGMAHPYHCLITQGVINHLSFNGGNYHHRVYLPPEFRGKHFKVQTMIQGWNFPSGSVSGTMASGYQDLDYTNGQFTIYFNGGGDWKTNCNIAYVVIA